MFRLSFPQEQHHNKNSSMQWRGFDWTFLGEKLTQYQPFLNWQNIAKTRN
jgi:hypothetical protein